MLDGFASRLLAAVLLGPLPHVRATTAWRRRRCERHAWNAHLDRTMIPIWTTRPAEDARARTGRCKSFATITLRRKLRTRDSGSHCRPSSESRWPGPSAWRCTRLPTPTLLPFGPDFQDLLSALSAAEARFLIVGGGSRDISRRLTVTLAVMSQPRAVSAARQRKSELVLHHPNQLQRHPRPHRRDLDADEAMMIGHRWRYSEDRAIQFCSGDPPSAST